MRACGQPLREQSGSDTEKAAEVAAFSLPKAMAEQTEKFEITDVKERTIVGESAKCFSATSQEFLTFFQTGEVCFSDDGLLLALDSVATRPLYTREFSMETLEVSRDVPDSDFDPPFPVPTPPAAANTPSSGQ